MELMVYLYLLAVPKAGASICSSDAQDLWQTWMAAQGQTNKVLKLRKPIPCHDFIASQTHLALPITWR
jgi:hypothetical protein